MSAVVAAIAAFAASASAQGDNGFLRGEGRYDISATYSLEKFKNFWVGDTKMNDSGIGKLYRESYNFWGAYGWSDDLDIVASAAIVSTDTTGTANLRDYEKVQDGVLGAKWRFFDTTLGAGKLALLATPAVKCPLSHYQANEVTAIGDGQIDYRFRAVAQYTADCGAYIALESGYDLRSSGTPDQTPVNLTIGATFWNRFTVSPFYEYMNSWGGKDIGQTDFPKVQEDYERWGVATYLRWTDRIGVSAGYKATIDGKNTGDLWGWWAGLVFRF